MGKINSIAKWKNNIWDMNPSLDEVGRSFSFGEYDWIVNDDGKYEYIIIANGSRVEDHSSDFINIKERKLRIDNVLTHYKRKNDNYVIKTFLMDADAPIVEDAKLFAKYIDILADRDNTSSINIINLSKCGVMGFYVPSFLKSSNSYHKTNIFNVATPYEGTKLASPLIFYPEVKQFISSKINNENISNVVYNKLIEFYESISSNSHMDYDIAIPGGIPNDKLKVYDESFIKNVFSSSNITSINRINSFQNILTGIDSNTLKEAISTVNFTGIGLCLLNDIFFEGKSDGMVYIDSQRKVENYLDIKSYQLLSAHHDVNSNIRVFNDILSIVDDVIEESKEKGKVKCYK